MSNEAKGLGQPESIGHARLSKTWIAVWALVGVNALWGLSFPIMKSLNLQLEDHFGLEHASVPMSMSVAFSAGMIGLRFLLSFGLLFLISPRLFRNASVTEWRIGAIVGLFFYFGLVLQVIGLATIPASRSGFLTSLTAVFTPILSALLFRKSISSNVILGVGIALLGVAILTGLLEFEQGTVRIASDALSRWTIGDTLTTFGSVLFTGQLMLVDHYGKRMNSTAITPGMFLMVVIASGLTFLSLYQSSLWSLSGGASLGLADWGRLFFSPVFASFLVFLALFCSVLAFVGMNRYQPHISAVQASVIYSCEPVFASAWALFLPGWMAMIEARIGYPNELLSLPLLLGGALVLVANVVALWPRKVN